MEKSTENHYRFLTVSMCILCLFAIALTIWAVHSSEVVYARGIYDEIYAIKKTFLQNTVRNVIRNIENTRAFNTALASEVRDRLVAELSRIRANDPSRFSENALELLEQGKYPGAVVLRLVETETGRIIFRSPARGSAAVPSSEREYRFGRHRLHAALDAGWIDGNTKASIAAMIHGQRFDNGGYVWVNEILNWEGGDNYAVRRIHPNLKDTEGDYLSTNTQDVNGNRPYLEELEGVRDKGEVFFTYFFKRPDSERIAEKLTYATLYKEYDWVIAMGVYLEDVEVYIDAVNTAGRALTARIITAAVIGLLMLFVIGLLFLSKLEGRYLSRTNRAILEESNIDPLTGAYNRRVGDGYLADTFNKFRHGTEFSALLLFDIDDFKGVNDRYGHKGGDLVLQAIVNRVKQNMRASDHLIRWGGEEFLILCYGISYIEVSAFADKMKQLIATMDIPIGVSQEATIRVTVSFGVAWFLSEDQGPEDALLRADRAMYRAKAAGKNRVKVQESR